MDAMKRTAPDPAPTPAPDASAEELLAHYRAMLLIRRFEEKAGQLYGMGLIGGFCHLYIGQEAVLAGCESAAKPGDQRVTSYRDHGHMLLCGAKPDEVMAELLGRAGGSSGGKGGSMHLYDPQNGFYGGFAIVGAQAPVGAGLAFANRYRGTDNLCFAYYGDGAADQGQVQEAMVLAARLKLPVIFVIENNRHEPGAAPRALYVRAEALGIPSEMADGMDVLAVRDAAAKAARHVRGGKGPYCLEMNTYRYRGHSLGEPSRARSEEREVRETRDAIEHVRDLLLSDGIEPDALKAIDREIRDAVSAAARFAQNSPEPAPEALWSGIYR